MNESKSTEDQTTAQAPDQTSEGQQTKSAPAPAETQPEADGEKKKKSPAPIKGEKATPKAGVIRLGNRKSGGEFLFDNGKVFQLKRTLKYPDMSVDEFDKFIAS